MTQESDMNEPTRQHHDAFTIAGLKVRTTNREEGDQLEVVEPGDGLHERGGVTRAE